MFTQAELYQQFEGYWKSQTNAYATQKPEGLYAPIHYISRSPGKRLRPILMLMAANLFSEEVAPVLPSAYTIELFHNFTLVHDDIMDAAPLRRGYPTIHAKWDENTGILSGDLMMILALRHLRHSPNTSQLPKLMDLFTEGAIAVCEGQQRDVDFESREDVTLEEYRLMIGQKTAALIACGMQMAALIAGATETDAKHVFDFAWHIGTAFQLQDDILDTFGDPKKFGKRIGGDIVQNKKTFLVLKALEVGSNADRARLSNLFNDTEIKEDTKIQAVTSLFHSLDIPRLANLEKQNEMEAAYEALDKIKVAATRKKLLKTLTEKMIQREI